MLVLCFRNSSRSSASFKRISVQNDTSALNLLWYFDSEVRIRAHCEVLRASESGHQPEFIPATPWKPVTVRSDPPTLRDGSGSFARLHRLIRSDRIALALDLSERAIVIGIFALFAYRMLGRLTVLIALQIEHPELVLAAATMNIGAILLVVSESLGVFLILLRRPSPTLSAHPLDWVLSFVAVNAPLLTVQAPASTLLPPEASSAVMFAGLVIQISAKATLWRSFGVVPANRGIKTGGLYRLVRHPIYAGYTLTHVGFLLGFPSLANSLLYLAVLLVQIARIMREEQLLARDPNYRTYMEQVRYRLVPRIY